MLKDLKEFLRDFFKLTGLATQIGMAIAFAIFIGLAIGYYLDKWLDKRLGLEYPWFTVIFLIFGVIAGFRNVYIIMKRIQREQKKKGL